MNIALIGSGGREHALCHKIYESSIKQKQISINSEFKNLKFSKKIKMKKSHLDHDRDHDDV